MQPTELVTSAMRELDRLEVIQAVVDRMLKPGLAAERLHLTVRQVARLVPRYRAAGVSGSGLELPRDCHPPSPCWRGTNAPGDDNPVRGATQEREELGGRQRPAQQETLRLIAGKFAERAELRLRLDAFRNDLDLQRARE